MTPPLIVVDGLDGSGKSTLAARIVDGLREDGVAAARISVDDFRRPVDWSRVAAEHEPATYYARYYDFALLDETIRAFRRRGRITIPRYDSRAERLAGTVPLDFTRAEVGVLEGVLVRRAAEARGAPGIYLAISVDEAARRLTARDVKKGRSVAEVTRRMHRRYFPAHHRYVDEHHPQDHAAILVDNEDFTRPRVLRDDERAMPEAVRRVLGHWLRR